MSSPRPSGDSRRPAIAPRDRLLLTRPFMLTRFMAELFAACESGLMRGHKRARRRLQKAVEYRRSLHEHHRRFE